MIKRKKHSIRNKIIFYFTMFLIGIIISFKELEKTHQEIDNKYNDLLFEMTFKSLSNKTYFDILKDEEQEEKITDNNPIIYIYNTHDKEEYARNANFSLFSAWRRRAATRAATSARAAASAEARSRR